MILLFSFAPQALWLQLVLLVAGIVVVLWGADRLTEGSVGLATRMGIPQIVIGLTIVAMGTSMPEFCVSLLSALKGTADLAVGNVVGSNIFNAMLIVGCAAMVAPITILKGTVRKDIPFALVASMLLFMMCLDGKIGRFDATVLTLLFGFFMVVTVRGATRQRVTETTTTTSTVTEETTDSAAHSQNAADIHPAKCALYILIGLLCLILGSNVFVDNASAIARSLGVSDAVIGLTIVAGGTSLPELATSVVAARKGNSGIAIGNVLGSSVFNILMILGITGLIAPMSIEGITTVDLSMMVLSMMLLWLFSYTKYRIDRWEGAIFTLAFFAYMGYLLTTV